MLAVFHIHFLKIIFLSLSVLIVFVVAYSCGDVSYLCSRQQYGSSIS